MIPKFRAWDRTRNEWSNGFFIYSEGGLYTPNYGFNRKHLKKRTDVYPIVKQERFILMQSTELVDINGKEIFEGDVVKSTWFKGYDDYVGYRKAGVVAYRDGCFCIEYPGEAEKGYLSIMLKCAVSVEIIGNIYENPELVEG